MTPMHLFQDTPRLCAARLPLLSRAIGRPSYDRDALVPSLAHLGVGAFFRCHQAEYADRLLGQGARDAAYLGINLRAPDIEAALAPQDGLYCRTLRLGAETERRVIGSVLRVIQATADAGPLIAALADPCIRVISLTVTEKGYGFVPATGRLDAQRDDVRHDISEPERPRTAVGLLAAVLERRRRAGVAPPALMSCDNIPANGRTLRTVLGDFLALRDDQLAAWFEREVATPSTMVDRIVPATDDSEKAQVRQALGCEDLGCVVGESFTQWVIEDCFPGGRPAWQDVGAELVAEVEPFEQMKHRLVNGCQSALAYLGYLSGYEHTCDVAADPDMLRYARDMMSREIVPTLALLGRYDLDGYQREIERRLVNPGIRHRTWQIAMDGSQKIRQRLLNPIRERLAAGGSIERLALGVAAWMRYVGGLDERGGSIDVRDPLAERLSEASGGGRATAQQWVDGLLHVREVFDPDLASDPRLRQALVRQLDMLLEHGARRTVKALSAS